jgi:alkanesulfonate monooxygenase SsuD/methylene tetrahydromethanopterin reductase-like flavin-dependent oxidoreductase (luciferase family)
LARSALDAGEGLRAYTRANRDHGSQRGYQAVWITEHHFNDYSVCPSIPVVGAYAAARTKRLHIATGMTLAAFYHPLRLAEEIALLDEKNRSKPIDPSPHE